MMSNHWSPQTYEKPAVNLDRCNHWCNQTYEKPAVNLDRSNWSNDWSNEKPAANHWSNLTYEKPAVNLATCSSDDCFNSEFLQNDKTDKCTDTTCTAEECCVSEAVAARLAAIVYASANKNASAHKQVLAAKNNALKQAISDRDAVDISASGGGQAYLDGQTKVDDATTAKNEAADAAAKTELTRDEAFGAVLTAGREAFAAGDRKAFTKKLCVPRAKCSDIGETRKTTFCGAGKVYDTDKNDESCAAPKCYEDTDADTCCKFDDDLDKCSTIAMIPDFCGAGKVYDASKKDASCAATTCDKETDVAACCKLDGIPDKCSSIATTADFCGAGKVYDASSKDASCAATTCDKNTEADVAACCTAVPECRKEGGFSKAQCTLLGNNAKAQWLADEMSRGSHRLSNFTSREMQFDIHNCRMFGTSCHFRDAMKAVAAGRTPPPAVRNTGHLKDVPMQMRAKEVPKEVPRQMRAIVRATVPNTAQRCARAVPKVSYTAPAAPVAPSCAARIPFRFGR